MLVRTALAFALLAVAGCYPSVAWTPDSGGLVYADSPKFPGGQQPPDRVARYDLGSGRQAVITEDAGTTRCPAVSPDGRTVAVADVRGDLSAGSREVRVALRITLYPSRGGRPAGREPTSGTFSLEDPSSKAGRVEGMPTALAWPRPDLLLLCCDAQASGDRTTLLLLAYDLRSGSVRQLPGRPFLPGPWFGGHLRPDGAGLLLLRGAEVLYYSLDGRQTAFALGEQDRERLGAGVGAGWSGRTFRVTSPDGSLEFDTETGKAGWAEGRLPLLEAPGRLEMALPFAGGRSWLCSFAPLERPGGRLSEKGHWIELQTPGEGRRRLVLPPGEYNTPSYFPSPDGRLVAVRFREGSLNPPAVGAEWIHVIDDTGEVLARVPLNRAVTRDEAVTPRRAAPLLWVALVLALVGAAGAGAWLWRRARRGGRAARD